MLSTTNNICILGVCGIKTAFVVVFVYRLICQYWIVTQQQHALNSYVRILRRWLPCSRAWTCLPRYKGRTYTGAWEQFWPDALLATMRSLLLVTGHLSEGSFVRNVVVQIPKFDAKPNPNLNHSLSPNPIRFGQTTFWTSELLPLLLTLMWHCLQYSVRLQFFMLYMLRACLLTVLIDWVMHK